MSVTDLTLDAMDDGRYDDEREPMVPRWVDTITLGEIVRRGEREYLNRHGAWRIEGDRAFIEFPVARPGSDDPGVYRIEVPPDDRHVLSPILLHHHRWGRRIEPHWRCRLYLKGPDGFRDPWIMLDVFVDDFEQLEPMTDERPIRRRPEEAGR